MKFEAVIFDLDGTLLNTLDDLADSMNCVLERNRLPKHEPAAYKYFVGDGMDMLVRRALPMDVADSGEFQRFLREMKNEYALRWAEKTRPYEGVPEMLEAFSADGLDMAVLTNKPDDATRQIIRRFLPDAPFRLVIGATPEKPKKPDPAVALEIAGRLNLPPERFVFVGDSSIDMRTAVAAGMFPVGALWGFRTREELIAAGAKMLFERPADLLPRLRQLE
ncbi:MAG: HAD family hydrolase [Hyphomicrobiales bacterium]